MFTAEDESSLQKTFHTAVSYLIILKTNPSLDQVAAACALNLLLQGAKKQSHLVSEQKLPDTFNVLSGHELITQNAGNQSLQVSFDYDENMVENVSYNIDQQDKKFHLIIRPKKGQRGLDPTTVEYSQIGIDADAIFLIGITSFDQIQFFYEQDEAAFTQAHTIAVNRQLTTFSQTNIDVSGFTSTSEWLILLLGLWQLPLTSEVATNLLAGIESSTDSFRHASVTADTFEIVAKLMRAGAHRLKLSPGQQSSSSSLAQAFAQKQQTNPISITPPKVPQFTPSQYSPPAR